MSCVGNTCVDNLDPGSVRLDPSTADIDPGSVKTSPSTTDIDPGSVKLDKLDFIGKFLPQTTEKSQATLDKAATLRRQAKKFADQAACLEGKTFEIESDAVSAEEAALTCEVQAECANETEEGCTAKTTEMLEHNRGDAKKQSAVLEGHRVGSEKKVHEVLHRASGTIHPALRSRRESSFGNHDFPPSISSEEYRRRMGFLNNFFHFYLDHEADVEE